MGGGLNREEGLVTKVDCQGGEGGWAYQRGRLIERGGWGLIELLGYFRSLSLCL